MTKTQLRKLSKVRLLKEVEVLREVLRRLTAVTWGKSAERIIADTENRVRSGK